MSAYKEMYLTLVRAQRDAILILQEAYQEAEEMLLSAEVPDHLRALRLKPLQEGEESGLNLPHANLVDMK